VREDDEALFRGHPEGRLFSVGVWRAETASEKTQRDHGKSSKERTRLTRRLCLVSCRYRNDPRPDEDGFRPDRIITRTNTKTVAGATGERNMEMTSEAEMMAAAVRPEELDDGTQQVFSERKNDREERDGPLIGDYIQTDDGLRRIAGIWGASINTAKRGVFELHRGGKGAFRGLKGASFVPGELDVVGRKSALFSMYEMGITAPGGQVAVVVEVSVWGEPPADD
jgi:hypothetical protein